MNDEASAAPLRLRRVVTGHDAGLRARVERDEVMEASSPRPGQQVCLVWSNSQVPADNLAAGEAMSAATGSRIENGAAFRVVSYGPGLSSRMHRTQTVDYGVVLSGAIDLELDDGAEVHLQAGDLIVQRGTAHRWTNRGEDPCVIAFVLIDALPIPAGAAD